MPFPVTFLAVPALGAGIAGGVTVTPIASDFVAIGQSYLPGAIGFGLAAICSPRWPPPPCGAGPAPSRAP